MINSALAVALMKGEKNHGAITLHVGDPKKDLKTTAEQVMRGFAGWPAAKEADLGGVKVIMSTSPRGDQRRAFYEKDGLVIQAYLHEWLKGTNDHLTKLFGPLTASLVVNKEALGLPYSA